jgi:hypothetical protein
MAESQVFSGKLGKTLTPHPLTIGGLGGNSRPELASLGINP